MGQAGAVERLSAAQFLAWDATQFERREFLAGAVYARAGVGEAHVTAAGNVAMALRRHLTGTPCRTFIADMKLRVEAADAFFYP